jgi:curved DNA-binding protein CbpA
MAAARDNQSMSRAGPYAVLGVSEDASDSELRSAYRRLVKRHHPDHNGGSAESAARFAEIQSAYTAILRRRTATSAPASAPAQNGAQSKLRSEPKPKAGSDPKPGEMSVEQRIRDMEQEIAANRKDTARQTKEAAMQAAARQKAAYEAVAAAAGRRPTREELGYYSTDDSFSMIVDDATEQLGERLRSSEVKRQFARRLTDLFGDRD